MLEQIQLVTFQLGEELYGVNIMDVREIVREQGVRPLPNSPPCVEGVFNLRGEIIPIINLRKRFHFADEAVLPNKLLSGFVILSVDGLKIGIIIDKVCRVLTVKAADVQNPPQMMKQGIDREYITGITPYETGYIVILDTGKLFSQQEFQKIEDARDAASAAEAGDTSDK